MNQTPKGCGSQERLSALRMSHPPELRMRRTCAWFLGVMYVANRSAHLESVVNKNFLNILRATCRTYLAIEILFLPDCFDLYIAVSAAFITSSGFKPCIGNSAMPILAVMSDSLSRSS
jgi:hypothetical protein